MKGIACRGVPGQMHCWLSSIPAFPERQLSLGYPESIGDASRPVWFGGLEPTWKEVEGGAWVSEGRRDGELSYSMVVEPREDFVEVRYRLTNESERTWAQSIAFNCVQCGMIPEIRDHECVRTWVRTAGDDRAGGGSQAEGVIQEDGAFRRLVEIPRIFGPRPSIQLYSVAGAPRGAEIPFVANFQATPDVVLEGWIAVVSRDGRKLVATVSKPALFLFQNLEYGCVHSGTGFGPLKPCETGEGTNRVYLVESGLEDWWERMRREM